MITARVYYTRANGHKLVTIPKNCDIQGGDYVQIIKMQLVEDETEE